MTETKNNHSEESIQRIKKSIHQIINILIEEVDSDVKRIRYELPESENNATLSFTPDGEDWSFRVEVSRKGYDQVLMNYMEIGTKEAVLAYMKSEKGRNETIDSVLRLSDLADERW